jgi:hypothetical protein
MPQVNLVSSVSPKYLTELAVGTRTPLMLLCPTGSAFRRYVNCTSFDFVGFTETRQLAHQSSIGSARRITLGLYFVILPSVSSDNNLFCLFKRRQTFNSVRSERFVKACLRSLLKYIDKGVYWRWETGRGRGDAKREGAMCASGGGIAQGSPGKYSLVNTRGTPWESFTINS